MCAKLEQQKQQAANQVSGPRRYVSLESLAHDADARLAQRVPLAIAGAEQAVQAAGGGAGAAPSTRTPKNYGRHPIAAQLAAALAARAEQEE